MTNIFLNTITYAQTYAINNKTIFGISVRPAIMLKAKIRQPEKSLLFFECPRNYQLNF